MVNVVSLVPPTLTPLGSEDELMISINVSLISHILSSFIGISIGALVNPARNVTVYCPET